jgi:hypothetical protein
VTGTRPRTRSSDDGEGPSGHGTRFTVTEKAVTVTDTVHDRVPAAGFARSSRAQCRRSSSRTAVAGSVPAWSAFATSGIMPSRA